MIKFVLYDKNTITWERAQHPIMGVWFPPGRGSELCSVWEEAGAGCPMRQECEDCGVCLVLEGERLKYGLARAGWSHTLKDKLLSLGVQGAGTGHTACRREKGCKGFLSTSIFLWRMDLMAGFPQQLFLGCLCLPWKSPTANASVTTCLPQEGAQGLL